MAIDPKDYRFRASQLVSLSFREATPRIIGFIEWLEEDAEAAALLGKLRQRDVQVLLDNAGYQNPPKAKNSDDVAAIGLAIIDSAKEKTTDIIQIGMMIGVRSFSSKVQASLDEVVTRYVRPLLQYLEFHLFERHSDSAVSHSTVPVDRKTVFVVHGRDEDLRRAIFAFLRAVGLNPLEWERALALTKKSSPYIGEVLDSAIAQAAAIVVLLTPDDEARVKPKYLSALDGEQERRLTGQARPNVLFEAGMAFGRHPEKTVLVQVGSVRPFSDIGGRHVIHLSNEIDARQALFSRLRTIGCDVDQFGSDWHNEGNFTISKESKHSEVAPRGADGSPAHSIAVGLSNDACILIKEASQDQMGAIARLELGEGMLVQTNGKSLIPLGDPRAEARCESALKELETKRLITAEDAGREYFKLTHLGYEVADAVTS